MFVRTKHRNWFSVKRILRQPKSLNTFFFPKNSISGKSAKERESHRKKKPTRTKHTQRERERTIGVDRNRDHRTVPISVDRDLARSVDRTIAIWRLRSERLRSWSRQSRSRWLRSEARLSGVVLRLTIGAVRSSDWSSIFGRWRSLFFLSLCDLGSFSLLFAWVFSFCGSLSLLRVLRKMFEGKMIM